MKSANEKNTIRRMKRIYRSSAKFGYAQHSPECCAARCQAIAEEYWGEDRANWPEDALRICTISAHCGSHGYFDCDCAN